MAVLLIGFAGGTNFSIAGVTAFLGPNKGLCLIQRPSNRNGNRNGNGKERDSVFTKRFFHFDADLESLAFVDTATTPSELTGLEPHVRVSKLAAITPTVTAMLNTELESEVLLDVSHLFLDFSVFVTESKPILKVAQVIGRLLILAQDYLPDKHVSPEELGIQVLMIAVCLFKHGESVSAAHGAATAPTIANTISGTTSTNSTAAVKL